MRVAEKRRAGDEHFATDRGGVDAAVRHAMEQFAQSPRFTDTVTSSCVFAYGAASCTRQYRYNDGGNNGIKHYAEPAEDAAEARERDKVWEARCRPVLRQDYYGVNRYVYAAPGCEYGRLY